MQRIIRAALGRGRFPAAKDGDREIIWPQDAAPGAKSPYRRAGGREHGDVPLPELASLADFLRRQGLEEDEDLIRGMQEHFGMGRLAISTRQRFEAALMSDGEMSKIQRRSELCEEDHALEANSTKAPSDIMSSLGWIDYDETYEIAA